MRWVCFVAVCIGASGQELGELSTERPGFTATSGAVGLGVLQLEQGYTFESARDGGSKLATFSAPQALVRFGITSSLELRFSTIGYEWRGAVSGPNDYVVGAKLRVLQQGVARPEVSIIGGVSLPAIGSAFTSSGHDPSFTLAAYKDLPNKFSVAANANMASITDCQGRLFSSGQSLWAARAIGGGVSIFGEAFHTTIGRLEGSEVAVDAGLFRGLGKHAQIDVEAGRTVAGARPSWFASVGCVLRAPRSLLGPAYRAAFSRNSADGMVQPK
jgi:Putative MetA-pathway of phenol degradation